MSRYDLFASIASDHYNNEFCIGYEQAVRL